MLHIITYHILHIITYDMLHIITYDMLHIITYDLCNILANKIVIFHKIEIIFTPVVFRGVQRIWPAYQNLEF